MKKRIVNVLLFAVCTSAVLAAQDGAAPAAPEADVWKDDFTGKKAYVVQREGGAYALAKDADVRFGRSRYVALYNSSDEEREFTVRAEALDLGGTIDAFDLVEMADVGCFEDCVSVMLAPHAASVSFETATILRRPPQESSMLPST